MSKPPRHDPHHHTVPVEIDDSRDSRELLPEENATLCAGCVKCCTYLAIEVDAPRAAWEYDQWIWALHHHGISLYVEKPERWYLHIEARCDQLDGEGRCSIYGRHPVLCREYDPRACERRLPLADMVAWFDSGEQLEAWIRTKRPRHFERLLAYRKDMPQGRPLADARSERTRTAGSALVTIGERAGGYAASGWAAAAARVTEPKRTRSRR